MAYMEVDRRALTQDAQQGPLLFIPVTAQLYLSIYIHFFFCHNHVITHIYLAPYACA
jgi:hypothetical protein